MLKSIQIYLFISLLYILCLISCKNDASTQTTNDTPQSNEAIITIALQTVQDSLRLDEAVFERVGDIMIKYENETKATQKRQFNNPKSKKQVMQNLLKSRRTELGDVLKPKEMMTFNKLYKQSLADARKQAREKKQLNEADRKALGEKIQAYRLESVMPVLKEQRTALEAAMSPTDKTQIAGIREKITAFNQSVKDKKSACAAIDQADRKAKMTCRRELKAIQKDNESIKKEIEGLIKLLEEKPGTQAIMTTMDTHRDKWRADLKKMLDTYSEEKIDAQKIPLGKYFRLVQPISFLMLDPEKVRGRSSLTRYSLTRYSLIRYSLTRYSLTRYSLTRYSLTRYSLTRYSFICYFASQNTIRINESTNNESTNQRITNNE